MRQHQFGIAFRIEGNHCVAARDVLVDQDFCQPGFADAGGTQHDGVADPFR